MTDAKKSRNYLKPTMFTLSLATLSLLTACGGGGGSSNDSINNSTTPTVNTDTRMAEAVAFDLLNHNRTQCGFGALTRNPALDITASNHANYMRVVSETNKLAIPTHEEATLTDNKGATLLNTGVTNPYFSGYALLDRLNPTTLGSNATKTNYAWGGYGENLAMQTVTTSNANFVMNSNLAVQNRMLGLLAAPYHMQGLLVPQFKEVGIGYQEAKWSTNAYHVGSILEVVTALSKGASLEEPNKTVSYPCEGVVTAYELTNEQPNPFADGRNLEANPVGQPIYVRAPSDKVIQDGSANISYNGQSVGYIHKLTASNDINKKLSPNEIVFIPDNKLQPNTTYRVNYSIMFTDGTRENRSFNFVTQPLVND